MIEKQIAVLTLQSYYLPINSKNSIGSSDTFISDMTWSNINLRTLLGDMWDKYDYFNLALVEISSGITGVNTTGDFLNVVINMKGLPFINGSYDAKDKLNKNNAMIGTYQFTNTNGNSKTYQCNNVITFRKEQEQCDINIFYTNINGILMSSQNKSYPNVCFVFNIIGVEIDKDENMKLRMIK